MKDDSLVKTRFEEAPAKDDSLVKTRFEEAPAL